MKEYVGFILGAVSLFVAFEAPAATQGQSSAHGAPYAPCALKLRVGLISGMPDPSNELFLGSLLSNHPGYQLSPQRSDLQDPSVIALTLRGPGPEAACREVVNSMRRDARVASVEVQGDASSAGLPLKGQSLNGAPSASPVQPMGTVHAGPDGDWILEPLSGVSYTQQARDRYECDIWAVDQTGFDPTTDDGGVPPQAESEKRVSYLRAEADCLQTRGYAVR
jgi:hypothetical protein